MMYYRGIGGLGRCFGAGLGYMNGGMGFLMMGGALLATALVVVLIVMLVKKTRRNSMSREDRESLDLLNERFVRGEITEEDYSRMKTVLRSR